MAGDGKKPIGVGGPREAGRYKTVIAEVFARRYEAGITEFTFTQDEFRHIAEELRIESWENVGDLTHTLRFRLPSSITRTAGADREWTLEVAGSSMYRFRLAKHPNIVPNARRVVTKIPDATPDIVSGYAPTDKECLLASIRYNRLIDIFLGLSTCSLQSRLRTRASDGTKIQIDETYFGVNRNGDRFILPLQCRSRDDKVSVVQTRRQLTWCREKFPLLTCRPVSAQFMAGDVIALFELTLEGTDVKLVDEKHYRLVPCDEIVPEDLRFYSKR